MTAVKVSVDDKLTNIRYVVQEESGQCTPEGVADAAPMDAAGDIEVGDEAVTNSQYVCVFATSSELDEDDVPIVVYQAQPVGEDATSGSDDDAVTPKADEDGGNGIWIIVGIVVVAIVGVVVVLVFLGKRNQ